MGRPCNKSSKTEEFASGKVTPVQVAFIVDQYLSDNKYTKTLSVFRSEASSLISKTKGREAPKNLLSLGAILDDYISLKEQKLMIDKEKRRVETLLQGMHDVMNAYNQAGNVSPVPAGVSQICGRNGSPVGNMPEKALPAVTTPIHQINPRKRSPPGYPMYHAPIANSMPMFPFAANEPTNFSTPVTTISSKRKRKASGSVPDALPTAKKSNDQLATSPSVVGGTQLPLQSALVNNACETVPQLPVAQSYCTYPLNGSLDRGSSVAKSLFKHSADSQSDSSCPNTPPQPFSSQTDNSISPLEGSSVVHSITTDTPQGITPANCHIIASETIVVSPLKNQGCYSVERTRSIFSSPLKPSMRRWSKRDHIKGRLDFDDSTELVGSEKPVDAENSTSSNVAEMKKSTSASGAEMENSTSANGAEMGDIFDIDIPNFDAFGADFCLSDLLLDVDLETEGLCSQSLQNLDPPAGFSTWLGNECRNQGLETNSSFEPAVLSEKDMNRQGPDSLISVKSVTKCMQIISPVKNRS